MTTLNASDARIPTDVFNRVAYAAERVRVDRRSGPSVYLISEADMHLLQAAKQAFDESSAKMATKYDAALKNLAE